MTSSMPLEGIRVIDMTEALAGPYCAMMLGDMGADVIKVERTGSGDQARKWGPPFLESESAYYMSTNRNKRCITVDIKDPDDLARLHKLLETADVFITNNPRLDSLKRYKLDPDYLRSINPKLIFSALSGYGHTGPKANRGGYDLIAQGETGLMAITGGPEDGPMRFPTPISDITGGLYSTIGILNALYARDKKAGGSGSGQFLDVALVDSEMTWLANLGGSYLNAGQKPKKMGNQHPTITPYQPVRAKDKDIIIAVGTQAVWGRFYKILDLDEALVASRFATNEQRNEHRDELIALIEEVLMTQNADHWIDQFVAHQIPAGPINLPDEILEDEHTLARGMVIEMDHPLVGTVRNIGNPINLSETPVTYRKHPPMLGEHNDEIDEEIGWQ
ncbi:CaiB/BaiF CoA transferase family protein [Leucothrix arctica]|uniref:CoA transferase n=1 Tax=Leucothrix arctica TaxID=1481894 RepID=A0A317CEL0_9GAMM|nr:CoA transferase [Leucothrix arctica]PWQ94740.1 CoA transferase [Leucothrix arctica]